MFFGNIGHILQDESNTTFDNHFGKFSFDPSLFKDVLYNIFFRVKDAPNNLKVIITKRRFSRKLDHHSWNGLHNLTLVRKDSKIRIIYNQVRIENPIIKKWNQNHIFVIWDNNL